MPEKLTVADPLSAAAQGETAWDGLVELRTSGTHNTGGDRDDLATVGR